MATGDGAVDWFKKLVQMGQRVLGGDIKNPHNLDGDFINNLWTLFDGLPAEQADLTVAILKYVVDGEGEEVLLRIRGNQAITDKLGYGTGAYNISAVNHINAAAAKRATLFSNFSKAPVEVWHRLANVLATVKNNTTVKSPPGWPDWLPIIFVESCSSVRTSNSTPIPQENRWTIRDIEKVAIYGELAGDCLVDGLLSSEYQYVLRGGYYYGAGIWDSYPGCAEYFQEHCKAVDLYLKQASAEQKVYALRFLKGCGFDPSPIMDTMIALAVGPSKTAREAVLPLLSGKKEEAMVGLKQTLANGSAGERNEAVETLWKLLGRESIELLKAHAETEKSDRVKQTIEKYVSVPSGAEAPAPQAELPPVEVELGEVPLSSSARESIKTAFAKDFQQRMQQYESALAKFKNTNPRPAWMREPVKPSVVPDKTIDQLIAYLEGRSNESQIAGLAYGSQNSLAEWLKPPEFKLIHFVRMAKALQMFQIRPEYHSQTVLWWYASGPLETFRNHCQPKFGLRELDAAVATLPSAAPGIVLDSYLRYNSRWHSFCDWEAEAVWPAFEEHPELLRNVLQSHTPDYCYGDQRRNVYKVLAMASHMPPEFIGMLWAVALGETKSERLPAQEALDTVPGKTEKIVGSLGDGKQSVRAAAADWLGRLGDQSAIGPLKKAFEKEKIELVKGSIMHALDALNANVDEFLDREKLLLEARSGLAKKRPKGMEWVPLDSLPQLHWADTKEPVDPAIIQWWVVQSIQQKSPVCGPVIRRYLQMCRKAEATNLSKFILSSWIGRETATVSAEDAATMAQQETDQFWSRWGTNQYYIDTFGSKEGYYKQTFQRISTQCIYSAIEQKGMLALVAAAADGDCVKMAEQYIRKFYGTKLAQCKALVEVLAWIDHPLALQTLLAIANRFRTKGIKEAAQEHVQATAERSGWTIDELADRTIPDGGFERPVDENGEPIGDEAVLELDFGPRQFIVRLNDELEPVVVPKGETKAVKTLPAPGKNDDAEMAKSAKKAFSDGKKVVKEVVKRQTERLYEALCTQRTWRFDDWQRYLCQHPIVGRLCVQLTWSAFAAPEEQRKGTTGQSSKQKAQAASELGGSLEGCEFLGCFRPLQDGSLTNEQDEQVNLPDDAVIVLAHTCNTSMELGQAWLKHFEDYDVTPLFQQFGRSTYKLPEGKEKTTEIVDFRGHMLTTYKLRNRATKLGYVRGQAEDGGCFYLYRKSFSSLQLQAVLEFTGSYLPEEDIAVALKELYFTNTANDDSGYSWNASKMPLGNVPSVLLSECYNDIKQIAAEGSGFDPKWEDNSYF